MKNRVVAGVLGILLGTLGVHKFYLGYVGLGAWGRLRRGKSQSLSLVVPVGAASDVNRPAMSPTTSSRVIATSRISRPTSRVRARPTQLDKIKNLHSQIRSGPVVGFSSHTVSDEGLPRAGLGGH